MISNQPPITQIERTCQTIMKTIGLQFKIPAVFGLLLMGPMLLASAATLTFSVNMSGQMALGSFSPASGATVAIAGNWNNWGQATPLTVSSYNPNVYVATPTVSDNVDTWYSYVITPAGGGSALWENSSPRWFGGTTGSKTGPVNFFNNYFGYIVGAHMSMSDYETNLFTYKINSGGKNPLFLLKAT